VPVRPDVLPVRARSVRDARCRSHVRRRGHWILGFFSGLLFGLGATVLLWQYNVWLLNILTAIVIPVAVGILVALVAWRGGGYTITVTAAEAAAVDQAPMEEPATRDEEPPPPAAAMNEEAPTPAAVVDVDDEEPPPPAP
jgi:hypothetical protein